MYCISCPTNPVNLISEKSLKQYLSISKATDARHIW